MDKLAFMTGYLSGLDNTAEQIEKGAAVVPQDDVYGYSPEALESHLYHKKKQALKQKLNARLIGAGTGMAGGAALGAKMGKSPKAALIGALMGLMPGMGVGNMVGESMESGAMTDDRPAADIIRDLKVRQAGPGSSMEEQYLAPFKQR